MPIPMQNLYPEFNIVRASHAELFVADIEVSRAFYVDTLGLQVTYEDSKQIFLRALEERNHHTIILTEGREASCRYLAFRVFSEEDLDKAENYFIKRDLNPSWVEQSFQGRTLRVTDPNGMPLEFYYKIDRLAPIHQDYKLYKGAKPLRIDHFNCFSPNVDDSVSFYNDLGFRTTEYTEDKESKKLWAAWMHRKGGVHDIAFTNGIGPRLHHIAFWVSTPLNIIDLLDLMSTTGYMENIERGPGRHGISNAFFLYILDPDGHRIELYCSDYQTTDPDHEPIHWDLKDPQRQTLWGAPAPKTWFENGSFFTDLKPRHPELRAQPLVAP